jgi:hypothetical protein
MAGIPENLTKDYLVQLVAQMEVQVEAQVVAQVVAPLVVPLVAPLVALVDPLVVGQRGVQWLNYSKEHLWLQKNFVQQISVECHPLLGCLGVFDLVHHQIDSMWLNVH